MNDNHTPDTEPIEIELKTHQPQADSAFQKRLEEQLMAQLTEKISLNEDNPAMAKIKRKQTATTTHITLIAAMLAIFLVGGLVVFMNSANAKSPASPDTVNSNEPNFIPTWVAHLEACDYDLPGFYDYTYYTLNGGETINDIAAAFNVSRDEIINANCLPNPPYELVGSAGATIRIPNIQTPFAANWNENLESCEFDLPGAYDYTYYEVRGGETLYDIARAFNASSDLIITANCLPDENSLVVGMMLRIPNVPPTPDSQAMVQIEATQTALQENSTNINDPAFNSGIPIMIAAQDIAVGEVITENMVYRVFWPRPVGGDAITRNHSFGGFYGNVEDVLDKQVIAPIRAFTPIHDNAITSRFEVKSIGTNRILPSGYVALALPIISGATVPTPMKVGNYIRIIATIDYKDLDANYQEMQVSNTDAGSDIQQTNISYDAIVIAIDTVNDVDGEVITLAVQPHDAEVLIWLIESGAPLTFAPLRADEAQIAPYILPPEGLIGDYASLNSAGEMRVAVFFSSENDALEGLGISDLESGMSVFEFDAFVTVGTSLFTDEDGISSARTSARILADAIYIEMLDVLHLHNIPYTYTLIPRTASESDIQSNRDDYVVIEPPIETRILNPLPYDPPRGPAILVIMLTDYQPVAALDDVIVTNGVGIIVKDVVAQQTFRNASAEVGNSTTTVSDMRLLVPPEDATIFEILRASGVHYNYTVIEQ